MKPPEEKGPMSVEEWTEMRMQFEKECRNLGHFTLERLMRTKHYPRRLSERERRYLDKNAEMKAKDPWGVL